MSITVRSRRNDWLNDYRIRQTEDIKFPFFSFYWQNESGNQHMVFVKGYDPEKPKQQTYHVHAAPEDHFLWNRIHFRDYLNNHPEVAKAYEDLKQSLAEKHKYERVAYRIAKTEFLTEFIKKSLLDI